MGEICHIGQESMITLYSWTSVSFCINNDLKGIQKNFMAVKKKVHLLQQLKGMQSSKLGICEGHHLSMQGIQKGYLLCQNGL